MKKQNWLLIVAVILLSALPLWFAPPPAPFGLTLNAWLFVLASGAGHGWRGGAAASSALPLPGNCGAMAIV